MVDSLDDIDRHCESSLQGGFRHEPSSGESIGHHGFISGPDGSGDRRPDGPQHQPPTARIQLCHLPNPKPVTALQAASLLFLGGLGACCA